MTDPTAEPTTTAEPTPGIAAYIVSLAVGLPNTELMVYLLLDGVLVRLVLALTVMSVAGCALAVAGMRARPRRFRVASLLLTLIPGVAIIAATAIFVVFLVALIQGTASP